ncbi:MAG TPA: Zn-ribbon domain-containing OB-fold protein [Candidatus Acidoferrum sp.]|nr:Zn-ribbon domain-containing OB-fold protein [Candidatus Acidoferrum sp.]
MTEPVITQRHFFEKAREGQLTAMRCGHCGELSVPPKTFCPTCSQRRWEPIGLSGEGTIASYTIIRVAPRAHAAEVPYAIAAVHMNEGVSLLGRVVDVPLERLTVGLPVRFRPLVSGGQTAVGFGPA